MLADQGKASQVMWSKASLSALRLLLQPLFEAVQDLSADVYPSIDRVAPHLHLLHSIYTDHQGREDVPYRDFATTVVKELQDRFNGTCFFHGIPAKQVASGEKIYLLGAALNPFLFPTLPAPVDTHALACLSAHLRAEAPEEFIRDQFPDTNRGQQSPTSSHSSQPSAVSDTSLQGDAGPAPDDEFSLYAMQKKRQRAAISARQLQQQMLPTPAVPAERPNPAHLHYVQVKDKYLNMLRGGTTPTNISDANRDYLLQFWMQDEWKVPIGCQAVLCDHRGHG